jgi:hypothetical protein
MLTLLFLFLLFLILCYIGVYCLLNLKEGFISPSRVAEIVEKRLDMDQSSTNNDDSICQTKCGSGSWCKQDKHCHGCEDIACGTQPDPGPSPTPSPTPTPSNRKLFLIPEAFGFNVPEINNQVELLPTSSISKHFDSIVVCANSAKYVPGKYDSNPSPPNNVMTDQWENQKVKDLKLPIECNADVSASTKINSLLKDYPFIDGFIMDYEDPKSVTAFSVEFKKLKKKYKFGLIGFRGNLDGWKSWASQHGGLSFDYYFNELYTAGMYEGQTTSFYNTGKDAASPSNAVCPLNDKASINKFWKSASKSCNGTTTIPTVCGSGNCQEVIYGTINDVGTKNNIKYECFDERLSGKFIMDLVDGKTQDVAGGNFAIWYGTGQAKSGIL